MATQPQSHNSAAVGTGWNFDNSYARLPETLFVRLNPVPVRESLRALCLHGRLRSGDGLQFDKHLYMSPLLLMMGR
jgi:hypothetical protein